MAKNTITKSLISRKEFCYIKGQVELKFTLRTNNSSELRPFKECMQEAIKDIDEILKGMKN